MNTIKTPIDYKNIAFLVICAICVLLLVVVFVSNKQTSNTFNDNIVQRDSIITNLKNQIEYTRQEKEYHQKQAQDIIEKIEAKKTYYIQNTKEYEKIPVYVRSLTKDSLRSEFANFK